MTTQYILSQVFAILYYVIIAITYGLKDRKNILLVSILALVSICLSYLFLNAWTGLAMNIVAIIRNLIFVIQNKQHNTEKIMKQDWYVLAFLVTLIAILSVVTYDGFYSLFAVFLTLLYTISVWQKSTKVYRILGIFVSICGILYNIFIFSIAALVLESFVLLTNMVCIIKDYVIKPRKVEKNSGNS